MGATTLDRVHQSMILFAAGRGEALKRFLVEDGAARTSASGDWRRRFPHSIRANRKKSAGSTECWRARKDWDSDMPLKPWYKVVTPREDLREGKPLDAAEFAIHLDQVRDKRAPAVYQDPEQFFDRTYLTKNLLDLASQAVRRLSGEKTGTSAVFNLATQFGGGKTHSLTLLYHLARHGASAAGWTGVQKILDVAEQKAIPDAAVAVFVGTEFDPVTGRGGADGTPLRMTPWGEIAFQLGGSDALKSSGKARTTAHRPGWRCDSQLSAERPAGPDSHGRADELHQPVASKRDGGPVVRVPPESLGRGARPRQDGPGCVDPGIRA